MMLFGREVNLPLDLAFGVDLEEAEKSDSCDRYVSALQDRLRHTYATAREVLAKSVVRNKRAYDLRSKPQHYSVGMWVWYYHPRRFVGRSPKFQRLYTGPFLITKLLGPVNVVLQKGPRANPFVTHVDKLKRCHGPTPKDWRREGAPMGEVESDALAWGVDVLEEGGAAGDGEGLSVHQSPNALRGGEMTEGSEGQVAPLLGGDLVIDGEGLSGDPSSERWMGEEVFGMAAGEGLPGGQGMERAEGDEAMGDLAAVDHGPGGPCDGQELEQVVAGGDGSVQGNTGRPRRRAQRPARFRD
jgi:hypothetical protein